METPAGEDGLVDARPQLPSGGSPASCARRNASQKGTVDARRERRRHQIRFRPPARCLCLFPIRSTTPTSDQPLATLRFALLGLATWMLPSWYRGVAKTRNRTETSVLPPMNILEGRVD
uniref:Uncharacterized protein n=1 Tax=Triticum urartu TaxID=4572 RepID=A0A8R7K3C5_TRIUA